MSILLAVQIRLEVTNTELWLAEPGNQSSQPQIMATPWPAAHTDTSPAYPDWWKDIRFRPRYLMIWMKLASAGISDQDKSQVMKHNSLCMKVNPTVLHSHLYPSRRSTHKRRHIISTVECHMFELHGAFRAQFSSRWSHHVHSDRHLSRLLSQQASPCWWFD